MANPRARGAAAVAVAVLVAVTACGPESGEVVDKRHREGYEYPVTQCSTSTRTTGTGTSARRTTYQDCWTEYRWEPPRWYLELENENADGETVTGERPVPEVTYGDCRIGDWYENGDCE